MVNLTYSPVGFVGDLSLLKERVLDGHMDFSKSSVQRQYNMRKYKHGAKKIETFKRKILYIKIIYSENWKGMKW